jgi:polyisoprenoid-binding protein YceI
MKPFRSFVPPLAAMLLAASGGAAAQGVLIDKSEIRFVSKQMGASVEGRFRRWKANVDFRPGDPAKSKANFEIELASIDLASEASEVETRRAVWFDTAKFPVATFASTAVRSTGADRYEVAGTLTIKGCGEGHRRTCRATQGRLGKRRRRGPVHAEATRVQNRRRRLGGHRRHRQ